MTTQPTATPHSMVRLDIPTGQAFDTVRQAFEAAVPVVDMERNEQIAAAGGTWAAVEELAAGNAPHGFMLYAVVDATPLLTLAGHTAPAVEYLMGNHVLAERMFRHHPATLLYAPLRVLLHADGDGRAVITIDQPSTVFAALGSPEIDVVAGGLDAKLAALLRVLDVEVPEQLLAPR